jgi:hypothetical protein
VSDGTTFKYCLRDYLYDLRERAADPSLDGSDFDKGVRSAIRTELGALEHKLFAFQIDAEALLRLEDEPFLTWNDDEPAT